eukprot:8937920-Ditylum_brightwellii.AAC.1
MQADIQTKWVKGHQDNKKQIEALRWEELLLAELYIDEAPVTLQITREIGNAWSEKAMRIDTRKHFQWKKQALMPLIGEH